MSAIEGDPVTIRVSVAGVRLAKANGKSEPGIYHLHFLIDAELPEPGIAIGEEAVHTDQTSVPLVGLEAGEHVVWVILGDGKHEPLQPFVGDRVTISIHAP